MMPAGGPPTAAIPTLPVFVGVDLGSVTTALAWTAGGTPERPRIVVRCERHGGDPLEPFFRLYRELDGHVAAVAATGVHSRRLKAPVVAGVPEEAVMAEAACAVHPDGSLTVVNIGGSGFSVLSRDSAAHWVYEKNDRCSAGTGQSMERLCARFGVSLEEAAELAEAASDALPLTARCAVFAKSELTHYANQGEPHARLFAGYFRMVAQMVAGLAERAGGDGPVLLTGGAARVAPLTRALVEILERPVTVAADPGAFGALGALHSLLARPDEAVPDADWPQDPRTLVMAQPPRTQRLRPAAEGPGRVVTVAQPAARAQMEGRVDGADGAAGDAEGRVDGAKAPARGTPDRTVAGAAAAQTPHGLVLGLDLGSTGSKAALIDAADGRVVRDAYRRTDGNPVEAARELFAAVLDGPEAVGGEAREAILAVGVTGSGREAAAAVFRAALPEAGERLLVRNEIVAHAAAAAHFDPEGGRSLSIVEIGGQDSKFINVRDGRVVESDMNRVCSAGTGSFLEEQALALGLDDIAGFGEIAAAGTEPLDLGQTCTVFVADAIVEAMAAGACRADVFAGLQYSVIRNYRNRVMGRRRFLDRVFFQGKPASNPSLARTLAAVTGREVVVPENPGAMGAIGIALLAREALERLPADDTATSRSAGLDLDPVREAVVVSRREFRCEDKTCGNLCRVESAEIEVGGDLRRIRSGGSCPRYERSSESLPKLPREAPRPFRERAALLDASLSRASEPDQTRLRVGLPYAHYLIDYLPFLSAFVAGLGYEPVVLRGDDETLARGDRRCAAPGACTPVKLLHGLDVRHVDVVLAPKFVHARYRNAGAGKDTCPLAQGAPEMLGEAAGPWEAAWLAETGGSHGDADNAVSEARRQGDTGASGTRRSGAPLLRPVLLVTQDDDLGDETTGATLERLAAALRGAARAQKAADNGRPAEPDREAVRRAWRTAAAAQLRFERRLRSIGRRALAVARERGWPVVLVAGETHVIHEPLLNAAIDELLAANGALAVPVDCYGVPASVPDLSRIHWASAGQCLRAAIAAMEQGDVYPLLLSAYGCGPASFLEPVFDDVLEGYPHAIFETDGHGGRAGYVTRVQAFLHAVGDYRASGGGPRAVEPERIARLSESPSHSLSEGGGTILFGTVGGTLGRHVAAAMRGRGLKARFTGATDEVTLRIAQEGCSGKECLPYQLLWGSLSRYLRDPANTDWADAEEVTFLSVGNGFRSCRANLFPLATRIGLDRAGHGDRIRVGDLSLLTSDLHVMPAAWAAVVGYDILNALCSYAMAAETRRGDAQALFAASSERLAQELERPATTGGLSGRVADALDVIGRVESVLKEAAQRYARLPQRPDADELPAVLLCGDIFLRVDEWGNDSLQRRLADLGVRVYSEPFGEFFELLAHNDLREQPRFSKTAFERRAALIIMRMVVDRLEAAVRQSQPWFTWQDIAAVSRSSLELFDGYPFGETIPTVGGALLAWRTLPVDGIVAVGPRGCAPALIAEAQLRRRADIPSLFVYNDGDPLDSERLAGFAWKLRAARRRTAGAVS